MVEDRGAVDGADVHGAAVDVGGDDSRAAGDVERMAADQAGDADLAVCLREVLDDREDARVDPAGADVATAGRVNRHAGVGEDPLLEILLRRVQSAEDRLRAQGLDVGREGGGTVARLHEHRERLRPRLRRRLDADAAGGDAGELEVAEEVKVGRLGLLRSERVLLHGHVGRDERRPGVVGAGGKAGGGDDERRGHAGERQPHGLPPHGATESTTGASSGSTGGAG